MRGFSVAIYWHTRQNLVYGLNNLCWVDIKFIFYIGNNIFFLSQPFPQAVCQFKPLVGSYNSQHSDRSGLCGIIKAGKHDLKKPRSPLEMKSDWHFSLKVVINIICAFQWECKPIFLFWVSINLCVLKLFPCFSSLISLLSFPSDWLCLLHWPMLLWYNPRQLWQLSLKEQRSPELLP